LYGSEGYAGKVRKDIQEDWDYWFMLTQTTETLIDGQAAYDIDYAFKKEIDLRILDENGTYADPLIKITPRKADTVQPDESEPLFYWLDYSTYRRFNLYPTPSISGSETRTMYVRYWKFLDDLDDNTATLEATEDVLSIEAPYLLIYKIAARICNTIENYERLQVMENDALRELQRLQKKDFQYKTANLWIPYKRI
jgi:hypothetical protein